MSTVYKKCYLKSASIFDQNLFGKDSPKKTISGLTTPPCGHLLHVGTPSFPSGLKISFFNQGKSYVSWQDWQYAFLKVPCASITFSSGNPPKVSKASIF